jgi:3D (Asp-Asp-Asp) domain-containing protein
MFLNHFFKYHKLKDLLFEVSFFLGTIFLGLQMSFFPSFAASNVEEIALNEPTLQLIIASMQNKTESFGNLPLSETKEKKYIKEVWITAYSSTEDQTDDSPFITASNKHVRPGIIAANFLPFGTKVKFPDLYGDEIFVVEDRMNKRYTNRVDIWMQERQDARNFGVQRVQMEIYK